MLDQTFGRAGADPVLERRADGDARHFTADMLGSHAFRAEYGLKYAYLAGAMYKGISSKEMVVALGRAGLMGYLGTGGMPLSEVAACIDFIQAQLEGGGNYGMNLLANQGSELERQTVELFMAKGVRFVEASSYMQLSESIVRYRLTGVHRRPDGQIVVPNRVLAKVSRPEVGELFMRPAPERMVQALVSKGLLTSSEAALGQLVPMAYDICVEADSGGHTDQGVLLVQLPAFIALRQRLAGLHRYEKPIRIGAAGGIGSPHAALAAFMLGADFVMTGSINQCTVEADTSDEVKDILAGINIQDTAYAPAGDLFELGSKVQVVKKGLLFPNRANKLYELYMRFGSLDELGPDVTRQLEEKYFRRSIDAVWSETRAYLQQAHPQTLAAAEANPKQKMGLVFRWYFVHSTRLARLGSQEQRVDYQIQCGPAMGSFNQWLHGSALSDWRRRHVADIGLKIMREAAQLMNTRVEAMRPTRHP